MNRSRLFMLGLLSGLCGWLVSAGAQGPEPRKMAQPPSAADPKSLYGQSPEVTEILGKTLEQWVKEMHDRDPSVRDLAIRTIPLFGEKARKAAARSLIQALEDEDVSCRGGAATAIATLGFETEETLRYAVSYLTRRLRDPQATVRYQAAMALAQIGPGAPERSKEDAIKGLAQALNDRSTWRVRQGAAIALGQIARGDPEKGEYPDRTAMVALTKGLRDGSAQVRQEVLRSLLILGPPGTPEDLQALCDVLVKHAIKDPDKSVAIWSRVCLMRNDPQQGRGKALEENLDALAAHLTGRDLPAAIQAAQALGAIGYDARGKVPDLVKLLYHEELQVVLAGMWAIGQMKTSGEPALPRLRELAKHENETVKQVALATIAAVQGKEMKPMTGAGAGGER